MDYVQNLIDKLYELIKIYADMGFEKNDLAFINIGTDKKGKLHFTDLMTVN